MSIVATVELPTRAEIAVAEDARAMWRMTSDCFAIADEARDAGDVDLARRARTLAFAALNRRRAIEGYD